MQTRDTSTSASTGQREGLTPLKARRRGHRRWISTKETIMRIAKVHLAWVMPVVALAVTLYLLGRVVDVLLLIILGAALVGMYLLRRYARAALLYQRLADGRREHPSQPHLEPERKPGRPGCDTGRRPGMRGETRRPWRVRAHGGRVTATTTSPAE
jgi:hypothetical protein